MSEPDSKRPRIENDEDDDLLERRKPKPGQDDDDAANDQGRNCPYLDTVKRFMLDFDFEKLCSVSLSNHNVYACLVCGKYFQGRGKSSYAYLHSIHEGHHVFINLKTLKVYCLPDGYEVIDSSLNDIVYVLKPEFTQQEIAQLDTEAKLSYDLNGKSYLPGFIGLNNVKANDYINVVIQAMAHIPWIRDYFIDEKNYQAHRSPLVETFGELVRKMWNPRAFKAQVSPHELIKAISNASQGSFKSGHQSDASEFLSWFLNRLHLELGGTKKPNSSIIYKAFQGKVEVTTRPLIVDTSDEGEKGLKSAEQMAQEVHDQKERTTTEEVASMFLTLELPAPPLFKNELDKNIIPQIPLQNLLNKFSGEVWVADTKKGLQRRYQGLSLPPYLIILIKRFTKNNWDYEKNPTIVNFPIKNADFAQCLKDPPPTLETHYDLVANITHEGKPGPGNGNYKAQVRCKANEQWFEIQDLFVDQKNPQMIFLSESYIQFWERKDISKANTS